MKIAVCTSNGSDVNLHFGKTENFYIYELDDAGIAQLDIRSTEQYCDRYSSHEHEFQQSILNSIFDRIRDCKMLFTVKIGDAPKAALIHKGLGIVECETAVCKLPQLI